VAVEKLPSEKSAEKTLRQEALQTTFSISISQVFVILREMEFFNSHRWDEKAGLRRDAIRSQVIDALEGARDKGDRQ